MAELNFSTGVITYKINGSAEVSFNPTDTAFVEKLYNTFSGLDSLQEKNKKELERLSDNTKIFEIARRYDAEMRERIDGVFECPVCDAIFGGINVFAYSDGLPIWANFMLSIIDEIDKHAGTEQKKTNARVEKYVNKYKKYTVK